MVRRRGKTRSSVFSWLQVAAGQFRNLDMRNPYGWPPLPRFVLLVLVLVLVFGAIWYFWLREISGTLELERNREQQLRAQYQAKLRKAVSLEGLKRQREQVLQYVNLLEKQLPNKAEMDALLSDINQAGLSRSLQFELFKPGQLVVRDYYAELPIALKVSGRYHDIGEFTADIANLSRIVTLDNLTVAPGGKDTLDLLALDATAKTYRYLDPDELLAVQEEHEKAGGRR